MPTRLPLRPSSLLTLAAALALSASAASAQTAPEMGAVAKPGDLDLSLPFEAGEEVYITAGYSPSGGSSLHKDTTATNKANDHYALDLILPKHPNNGLGRPVLAALSGQVVRASWATSGWANYGLRVIIRTDHSDGHTYHSLYAHLDQLSVSEGDFVMKGDQIGTLGDSCEGDSMNRSCPFFGAHLHFALHQDSTVGGSGTGGSYGGRAVVPELIDGYGNLTSGQTVISQNNGGGPVAPRCPVENGERVVEENDPACFRRVTTYWWDGVGGHAGAHLYTWAIPDARPDTQAWWSFDVLAAATYDVHVYTPAAAQSQRARYTITSKGSALDTIILDQSATPDAWVKLGTYPLGADERVEINLADNTGEPFDGVDAPGSRRVAFDAARISLANTNPDPPDMGMMGGEDMGDNPKPDMGSPDPADMGSPSPDMASGAPEMGAPTMTGEDMATSPGADMRAPDMSTSPDMSPGQQDEGGTTIETTGSVCASAPPRSNHPDSPLTTYLLALLACLGARGARRQAE